MTAPPNQNLKTSKHLDNSGPSCKSKLERLQKLCNHLITVAKSRQFKTCCQTSAPAAKSKQQLRNGRITLSPAANQRPRKSLKIARFPWLNLKTADMSKLLDCHDSKHRKKQKTHATSGCIYTPKNFETLTNQSKDKSVSSHHTGGKISSQDLMQQLIEHTCLLPSGMTSQ